VKKCMTMMTGIEVGMDLILLGVSGWDSHSRAFRAHLKRVFTVQCRPDPRQSGSTSAHGLASSSRRHRAQNRNGK